MPTRCPAAARGSASVDHHQGGISMRFVMKDEGDGKISASIVTQLSLL
jgi:hypothetical protein